MTERIETEKENNFEDMAVKLVSEKKYKDALKILDKIIKTGKADFSVYLSAAMCCLQDDDKRKALRYLNKALKQSPDNSLALLLWGNLKEEAKKYVEAEKARLKLVEVTNNSEKALKLLIFLYIKRKKFKKVEEYIEKYAEVAVDKKKSLSEVAEKCLEVGEAELSVKIFANLTNLYPNDAVLLNNYGTALCQKGDVNAALKALEASFGIEEKGVTLLNMSTCFEQKGEFEKSYECCKKAYEKMRDKISLAKLSNAALLTERHTEALNGFKILVEEEPDNEEFTDALIKVYKVSGMFGEALELCNKMLKKNPKANKYRIETADIYILLNEYETAKKLYAIALRKGKATSELYCKIACLYEMTGDSDNAEKLYRKAILLDNKNASAHKDLSVIYMKRRHFDFAREELKKAYALSPENPDIIYEYGNFFQLTSDRTKAAEFYRKIINSDFLHGDKAFNVALNFIELGNYSQAEELLKKCLKEDLQNVNILYTLGRVYMIEGKHDIAKQLFEDAYFVSPNAETANMLALICLETEDFEQAYNLFKAVDMKYPGNISNMMNLAKTALKLNKRDEALKYLQRYTDFYPEDTDAIRMLADLAE